VFALPGIGALIIFILARPQEFFPLLQRVPFLYLFTAFAVIGYIIDIRLRRLLPIASNTLVWVGLLLLWAVISAAINTPQAFMSRLAEMLILFALYGTIAHGIQRFRSFQIVAGVLATTCLFIAAVCAHQGFSGKQCIGGEEQDGNIDGEPDGRECNTTDDCRGPDSDPGLEYRCEKVGLFGTYSVEERVRYRGDLKDPNEVALTICAGGMALLIGFALRRRGLVGVLGYGSGVVIVFVAVFLTQSRGGLIAAMLVPGVYLIRRYGIGIAIPCALVGVPVMLLGGRSGEAADLSTEMRYDAWSAGLDMWHHSPIFGVGPRAFVDHNYLTAHNSFVLSLGELGFVGLFLFTTVIFLCIKTLIVGLRELRDVPGSKGAQIWGMALLAGLGGIIFQINTLSFTYHPVLWMYVALIGGWYLSVRTHVPTFEVKVKLLDAAAIIAGCALYAIVVLPLFLRAKGVM
jgi:hypothetical protein